MPDNISKGRSVFFPVQKEKLAFCIFYLLEENKLCTSSFDAHWR